MTKISVIVAAYNIENYIGRCLDSIVNQHLKSIEIIVVNDGSTDKTLEIIENYKKCDDRVKIINKKNAGLIEARKTGIENSTGDYLIFVDGDDWLRPDGCLLIQEEIEKRNPDIIYYNLVLAYDNHIENVDMIEKKDAKSDEFLELVLLNKVRANIVLQSIRRNFLIENNIMFPENITYGEDLLLTLTLAVNNPVVSFLDEGLYYYYQRGDSITNTVSNKILDVKLVISAVKKILKEKNMYMRYKEEFDFLVFMHIFYYRLIDVSKPNKFNKIFYDYWKKQAININVNKYCIEFIKSNTLNYKIKIKNYNVSYRLGILYMKNYDIFYAVPKKFIKKIVNKVFVSNSR